MTTLHHHEKPRILFINSKRFDYAQDLLYCGLNETIGPARIKDSPRNWSYLLPTRTYPKNLGYSGLQSPIDFISAQNITPENCDAVIVASCKPDAFLSYQRIQKRIPASTPIALIDGGDLEQIGGDLTRLNHASLWGEVVRVRPFDFIFKREYLKDREYPSHVYPFPFSMNIRALALEPKYEYDKAVSFWAVESHPIRTRALEKLKGHFDCDFNGTSKNQTFKSYARKGRKYHEELSRCRIVLNLRGGGWDTLRYWEVPALGPLMVTQPIGIVIPDDFVAETHVAHCREDLSDLIDVCRYYLDHEDKRLQLAKNAYSHLLRYHLPIHRARFLLKKMDLQAVPENGTPGHTLDTPLN